jgi:hypothetical protein
MKSKNLNRKYQVGKRRALSIELFTENVFMQKLDYIPVRTALAGRHENPVKAGLVKNAEEYHYSSAEFYHNGRDSFNMLTHYSGN